MHLPLPRIAALALALALAAPAFADVGADAVVPEAEVERLGLFDCATGQPGDFAACLAGRGVAQAAIDFAERLTAASDDMAGLLVGLSERGKVDLATILYPGAANANIQVAFVNGTDPLILASGLAVPAATTPGAAALQADHPDWMAAGPMESAGYRDLPDGTQRFVLIDRITDGCRACEVLAISVVAVDFRDGALSETATLDWVPPAATLDGEAALAALVAGRVDVLQYRLLRAGHDIGGLDGAMGARTGTALAEFLAAHCLPEAADLAGLDRGSLEVIAGTASAACD